MPKKLARRSKDWLFPQLATAGAVEAEASLLDVVDNVLNKGLALNGDLILGVANVDLIYVRLSALIAALDKVADRSIGAPARPRRRRRRRKRVPL
jgi:gas vesicle protein GvpA/GvpJ/GvpM family